MADDEFVIGFSDSEWTGIAPLLEEDVAMSSLAQDELGHAATLYGLLAPLTGTDADALAYDREPAEYRHCRLLDHGRGDWAMTIARRFLYDSADAIRLDALAAATWAPLAELVGKLVREERYHRMHAEAWLARLARRDGEPRERLLAALDDAGSRCRDRVHASPRRAGPRRGRHPRRADVRARSALAGVDRAVAGSVRPPDAAARRGPAPRAARPWRAVPLAVGRVHLGPTRRPRSDLVSEAGTQIGIARLRAGVTAPTPARPTTPTAAAPVDLDAVHRALAEVMDPELPMLSVVDLGIVHRLEVGARDGVIRVEILPTFVGCPALELIKTSIADRLAAFGRPVEVTATFEVPWTSERISPAGRRALLAAGIAPPTAAIENGGGAALIELEPRVPCPHCGSRRTTLENVFGPTQCRTIRYCADCRQPFEAIKPV